MKFMVGFSIGCLIVVFLLSGCITITPKEMEIDKPSLVLKVTGTGGLRFDSVEYPTLVNIDTAEEVIPSYLNAGYTVFYNLKTGKYKLSRVAASARNNNMEFMMSANNFFARAQAVEFDCVNKFINYESADISQVIRVQITHGFEPSRDVSVISIKETDKEGFNIILGEKYSVIGEIYSY